MGDIGSAFGEAANLILALDQTLYGIVLLSLQVSLTAVAAATAIGLPLGAALAIRRFPGRPVLLVTINALMGLPPVVAGLLVYLLLSRAGPLGALGLLFTPTAMVVAQTILVIPIVAGLSRQVLEDAWHEYEEQLRSLGATPATAAATLLWDTRHSLVTVVLAGFGRAAAEVGAVMIVGGNIDGVTRVMTTTISLEASKGDLPLALGLGIILVTVVFAINAAAQIIKISGGAPLWVGRDASSDPRGRDVCCPRPNDHRPRLLRVRAGAANGDSRSERRRQERAHATLSRAPRADGGPRRLAGRT